MNQVATQNQQPSQLAVFHQEMEKRKVSFAEALPAHIKPEKFLGTIMTVITSNPDLLKADRRSLITACMKSAQDGLVPDGREAALVKFNTRQKDAQGKWSSVALVQYMPMVYGLRKKILQSGEIKDIQTGIVYRQEIEAGLFIYEEGVNRQLMHRPMLDPDFDPSDDDIAAAYSVAVFEDGSHSYEVMPRREINKVRQASQTGAVGRTKYNSNETIPPKGPWVDWFSEMARKSVMRRHSKTLPMSSDLTNDVESMTDRHGDYVSGVLREAEPDAPVALPSDKELQAEAEGADPATGEIVNQQSEAEQREIDEQLDAEQSAQERGMAGDEPEEQEEAEPADDTRAWQAAYDEIAAKIDAVKTEADWRKADALFQRNAASLPEDEFKRLDETLTRVLNRIRDAK